MDSNECIFLSLNQLLLSNFYNTINIEIALRIASKWLKTAYPTATLPVPPTSNQRTASICMANRSNIVYLRKLSCNSLLGDGIRSIWRIVSAINASLSFTCGALARKRFFILVFVIIFVLALGSLFFTQNSFQLLPGSKQHDRYIAFRYFRYLANLTNTLFLQIIQYHHNLLLLRQIVNRLI